MKKGDIVTIKDSSWTRSVVDGKLVHELLNHSFEYGKKYTVVETGCMFPNTGSRGHCFSRTPPTFNNTVIQAVNSGEVVFVEERFLESTTHTLVIDGESVELSHESYLNLKEQLA